MIEGAGSHDSASAAAIRRGALALLAAGNSLEAVAHVFAVPVETVRAWACRPVSGGPADAMAPADAHVDAQAPADADAQRPERATASPASARAWTSFPRTTVYALGPMGRYAVLALGLILAGCPVLAWPFVSEPPTHASGLLLFALATLLCLGTAACALLHAFNARFELRPHAVAKWGLSGVTVLPFSQIVGLTTARNGKSASWAITLHTAPGTPPMTINPEDAHLRDPALVAWLGAIPLRQGDPVRPPRDSEASAAGGVLAWLLNAVAVVMVLTFLRLPIDAGRAVFAGYPPLQRLSLTEGRLTHVGPCIRPRRGASYLMANVRTDAGDQTERLDCTFDGRVFLRPGPYRISIWRDTRTFSDNAVRQVDLDGRRLQDYDAFVARSRRHDPAMFVWELMMSAALGLLAWGMVASNRRFD